MLTVNNLLNYIDKLAPAGLACDWDNCGLQVGSLKEKVKKMALALDPTLNAVKDALSKNCQVLITHHPLIFKPLKNIDYASPAGQILLLALKNNLTVISAHTNWDAAKNGVTLALANELGLINLEPLEITSPGALYKLVTFVPKGYELQVREALFAAGAGSIGDYTNCWFAQEGWGGFKVPKNAQAFIGKPLEIVETKEVKVEVILPKRYKKEAIKALKMSHPYEAAAWDILVLDNCEVGFSFGGLASYEKPKTFPQIVKNLKDFSGNLKIAGPKNDKILFEKIALMPGSGGSYIKRAKDSGAQAFISGDISHHQALDAIDLGLFVFDVGHFESEWPSVISLGRKLKSLVERDGYQVEIELLENQKSPWRECLLNN